MFRLTTNSSDETFALGCRLGKILTAGMVVALNGQLGAGKTLFAQGIARGIGVREAVSSPTFTLIQEYQGRFPLYHFDFYRLDRPEELENLGYEEYIYGEGVCVIEWAEKFSFMLPQELLEVCLKITQNNPQKRLLKFIFSGEIYNPLQEVLRKDAATGD